MTARRVLFSATLVRGHIAKFHLPYLKWFKEQGWETWVAAHNDYPDGACTIPYCDAFVDIPFERSPFSWGNVDAYRSLRRLFASEHFDLIHTHTPVGSVLTRLAARNARRSGTPVLYTAHGFHFFRGAPVINWLFWYPVERVLSRLTDVLITINTEDCQRACRFAHCTVAYVPGVGINTERFAATRDVRALRESLGLADDDYVLLSVGDLIVRKNQEAIVRALCHLPAQVKLLICGEGTLEQRLRDLSSSLRLGDRVRLLGFRDDIPDLMHLADALVFPSLHEGLPVAVQEAMASGLPVIASAIRGVTPELIKDHETGLLLADHDEQSIAAAVTTLMEHPEQAQSMATRAQTEIAAYDVQRVTGIMAKLYRDVLEGGNG